MWNGGGTRASTKAFDGSSIERAANDDGNDNDECISACPNRIESMDFQADHVTKTIK